MPPAARKGDPTAHGGLIVSGSPDTTIGNMPAARLLDKHVCPLPGHVAGPVTQTSPTVFINALGAARLTDSCTCAAPAPGAGGGGGARPMPVRFGLGLLSKVGDRSTEWRKTGDGPVDKRDASAPMTPRLTAELSKEFAKGGNYLDKRDQIFATNVTERGGKAKVAYDGDLKNLANAKAEANVGYEASYSAARARVATNQMRPDGTTYPGASAEARLLTARAGATAGTKFEVKDGKLQSAFVQAEAGAGASVVEGRASGQSKFFKIPFINRRVSFGGEVSGALLTAEAKASAFAGLRDNKWSFGFSAKLGAALAGAGIKFNVVVDKCPPPEPPKAAPGVPGFAGIDPIATGCPTVLIGSAPPPYVPGVPPRKPKPGEVVGGPGGRNVAEKRAETQDEDAGRKQRRAEEIELATKWADDLASSAPPQDPAEVAEAKAKYDKRQKENREAYQRVQRGELVHPNTTPERLALAVEGDDEGRRIPLTYKSKEQFEQFQKELKEVFASEGITDATVQQVGSATSGFKGNPKKPFGYWSPTSDTDFAVFSKQSLAQAKANDAPVNTKQILGGKYPVFKNDLEGTDRGFYHTPVGKKLEAFAKKWNKELYGREDVDGIDFKLNTTPKPFGTGNATTIVAP